MQILNQEQKQTALGTALVARQSEIEKMLPDFMTKQSARFFEVVLAATKNGDVAKCSPMSVVEAVVRAAQWGLLPDGVHGALVPYGQSCTFVPMYRGLVAAYRRSGDIKQVWAEVVFEADEFEYEVGINPILRHVPKEKIRTDPSKVRAAYACARWADGRVDFVVMTLDELEFIHRRSRAQNGPWKTDTCAMYLKCPVRRLSKFLPLSPEIQQLVAADEREDMQPEEREAETVASKPLKTRDDLVEALAPLEPQPAQEAPGSTPAPDGPKVVHGVRITLREPWDAWAQSPLTVADRIAIGSPLLDQMPERLVETATEAQVAEIKRLVGLGKAAKEPHRTIQKLALTLAQIEPEQAVQAELPL